MEKPLFDANNKKCEYRTIQYRLEPSGGAWASIMDADAIQIETGRTCELTRTGCVSEYRFDCPRYANAIALLKEKRK